MVLSRERLEDRLRDGVGVLVEREVAGIEAAQVGRRHNLLHEFRGRRQDNRGIERFLRRLFRSWNCELDEFCRPLDRFVRGIRQFELDLMRTRCHSDEDQRFAARVDDRPRLAIDEVVKVSNTWRDRQGGVSEHRQDAQVFSTILDGSL